MTELVRRQERGEEGLTLIELLVVIVIIGILSAIVVFAVGGITDKGQTSACDTDVSTLRTAEEAYFAQPTSSGGGNGSYGSESALVPKFLAKESTLHNITLGSGGASYTITRVGTTCPAP